MNGISAIAFPSNGNDTEKQKWILDNPDDINLRDSEQKKTVENYLINQKTFSFGDKKMLGNLVEYYTLDKINVDLSKGQGILLKKEGNNLFLISSDGQKHDLVGFNSLNIQGRKLEKIQSRDDGTIELSFGEDSIHLKDNTLKTDTFGGLILGDGTVLGLKDKFGKLDISGNSMKCFSAKCSFSLGFMENELNQNGVFNNLGNNRFSVVDGKTKIGGSEFSGNFDFSTDKDRKKIDFSRKINLGKIKDGIKNVDSFVKVDSEIYGKTQIGSTLGEKVIACFTCADFVKTGEKYDGYVDLKRTKEKEFGAEIMGKVGVKFEDDASHNGFDKNLLLTYDSNPNEATFKLKSCEGCADGGVGLNTLNGQPFQIRNENGEFGVRQLNPAFPITEDYSRKFYLTDTDAEGFGKIYSVSDKSAISIEKIDSKSFYDYQEYRKMVEQRESKKSAIDEKLSKSDKIAFASFVEDMKFGKDGEIVLAGETPSLGGKPYPFGEGNYISIRDAKISKCIDEGKCNLQEIADLGKINREVAVLEKEKKLNALTLAMIEASSIQRPEDALVLAFGGVGSFAKAATSARGVFRAGSASEALMAAGKTGVYGADAMLFGFAGVKPGVISKFDEALSVLPKTFDEAEKVAVPVNRGRPAYLDSLAGNLAEKTGLPAEEIKAVGLGNKFFTGGKGNEPLDVVAFVHTNPATGEVTPLSIGVSHFTKKQAENHMNALNQLDEVLGEGHDYGFKGVISHNTRNKNKEDVDAYTVLVGDLPPETQAKVSQAYDDCCSSLKVSDEANGFAGETTSLRMNEIVTSGTESSPKLPEIETRFEGFFRPEKDDFGLSETVKSLGVYDKNGENVGTLRYRVQDDTLEINHIRIHPESRGEGYSSAIMSKVLDENPDITKIVGRMEEVNKQVFMEKLVESLGEKGKIKVSKDSPDLQFRRCCSEKFQSLPAEEREVLIKTASEATPFYRSWAKKGFDKVCDIRFNPETIDYTRILLQICK